MRSLHWLRRTAAGLALVSAACIPQLQLGDALPSISCESGDDCPPGLVCNTRTSRCVPADRDDLSAPVVCEATVTPSFVHDANDASLQPAVVRLVVDEPLAFGEITFIDGDVRAFGALKLQSEPGTCPTGAGHVYRATYVAVGDERENIALPLRAVLEDELGNRGESVLPASLTFDFNPPTFLTDPAPTVTVVPDPLNPVALTVVADQIASATSQVLVSFTTSEMVDEPLLTTIPPSEFVFQAILSTGLSHLFELDTSTVPGEIDETFAIAVTLTDVVGNVVTVVLPNVVMHLDTDRPAAPDVETLGRVRFVRAPWGNALSSPNPQFTVQGETQAVEPFSMVQAFAGAASSLEIGRGLANESGAFGGVEGTEPIILATRDVPTVWLRAIDRAGNASPRVAVRDITWTATLGDKIAGESFPNPHTFYEAPVRPLGRDRGTSIELGGEAVGQLDGDSARTEGAGAWIPATPPSASTPLAYATGAYEPLRGEAVLLGGLSPATISGVVTCATPTLTSLALASYGGWRDEPGGPTVQPDATMTMVYDGARQELLLMGGETFGFFRYRGSAWERVFDPPLSELEFPCEKPGGFLDAVYDPIRRLVYFTNGTQMYAWDGAAFHTLCRSAACLAGFECPVPFPSELPPRTPMVFDENLGEVLVFGMGATRDETWSFDGSRWLQRCTEEPCLSTRPPGRTAARMAFDRARNQTVLFGGQSLATSEAHPCTGNDFSGPPLFGAPVLALNDTWIFDGHTWSEATPTTIPPGRAGHVMVFHEARGAVLMAGGTDCECHAEGGFSQGLLADTWFWNGDDWTTLPTAEESGGWTNANPGAATHHVMATEPTSGEPIMLGGGLSGGYRWHHGRWQRNPSADTSVRGLTLASPTPASVTPPPDPSPLVRYGGYPSGNPESAITPFTEIFTGDSWNLGCSSDPCIAHSAGQRAYHAAATDGTTLVLFGGSENFNASGGNTTIFNHANSDTYLWEPGIGWSEVCTDTCPRPSPRAGHAMSYAGNGLLLFGGATGHAAPSAQTWRFIGTTWTLLEPATVPPARGGHVLVWDPRRQSVLLAFGNDHLGYPPFGGPETHPIPESLGELWEWAEDNWHRVRAASPLSGHFPVRRYGVAAAYSTAEGRVVFYGGTPSPVLYPLGSPTSTDSALDDTWLWDGGTELRPAQRFVVSLSPAGEELIADPRRIEIEWHGTATSILANETNDELVLTLWDGLGERTLSTQPCGPACRVYDSAHAPLPGGVTALKRYLDEHLIVTGHPAGTNGAAPGYGAIVTDFVEVRISYRRP